MTSQIADRVGFVLLVSAIAVLCVSIYLSSQGERSMGLSGLGTVLLVLGVAIRMSARRGGARR